MRMELSNLTSRRGGQKTPTSALPARRSALPCYFTRQPMVAYSNKPMRDTLL